MKMWVFSFPAVGGSGNPRQEPVVGFLVISIEG